MLESMTYQQYIEWLAFFKIRNEADSTLVRRTAEQETAGSLSRALDGYQQRRGKFRDK